MDSEDAIEVHIVEFNYDTKVSRQVPLEGLAIPNVGKLFVWVNVNISDEDRARKFLESLEILDEETISQSVSRAPSKLSHKADYVSFFLPGCWLEDGGYYIENTNCIIGQRFFITTHWGENRLLNKLEGGFVTDLVNYARNPSFLVYELWHHLIDNFQYIHRRLQERLFSLDATIVQDEVDVDDSMVKSVLKLHTDFMEFRRIVLPARMTLTYLATRSSTMFINDTAKPFLSNMVDTIDRLVQDINQDRQVLHESLGFNVSLTSYKMNKLVKKLTSVSIIFLPLMFIASVYGMNFEHMPEFQWKYGYLFFWGIITVVAISSYWVMIKSKLL